ncbi:MAG TPA: hypothetical protein VGJ14_17155 [Sporichthyaceae bacterium]
MDALRHALLLVHLAGMAVLLGGFLLQAMSKDLRMTAPIVVGAPAQLISGALLVLVDHHIDHHLDTAKISTKLAIALVVTGLVHGTMRRVPSPPPIFYGAFGLAAANVVIAYAWS